LPTAPPPTQEPRAKTVSRTPKLSDLLKGDPSQNAAGTKPEEVVVTARESFTAEQLHKVWLEFAEQRKKFQVEYQLLLQPYTLEEQKITVMLYNHIQEGSLNNIRGELGAYLREKLRNGSIQVFGEFVKEGEAKKIIYTNREKFEYLVEKNPVLRELKDRLGLDTDF
jgi:DNA polymerase-3 subunit gamma/tau